jgi:hypothetical protein
VRQPAFFHTTLLWKPFWHIFNATLGPARAREHFRGHKPSAMINCETCQGPRHGEETDPGTCEKIGFTDFSTTHFQ